MSIITLIGVDPGLATHGLVVVRTDGMHHEAVHADVFTSKPTTTKLDIALADDRVRRTRALSRWLEGMLTEHAPNIVAAEAMSFPRGAHAITAICLAWGVLVDQLELRQIPLVAIAPWAWRKELTPTGRERPSHRVAVKRIPSFPNVARHLHRRDQVHALDALGVACWAIDQNIVRAMVQR